MVLQGWIGGVRLLLVSLVHKAVTLKARCD